MSSSKFYSFFLILFLVPSCFAQAFPDHPQLTPEETLQIFSASGKEGLAQRVAREDSCVSEIMDLYLPEVVDCASLENNLDASDSCIHEIKVIHGTFAAAFDWYKEGGDFFEAVRDSAQKRFGSSFTISPFKWTGYLGCVARIEGATELAKEILHSQNKIYLVGHSHGGNVINLCSQMIELAIHPLDERGEQTAIRALVKQLIEMEKVEAERYWRSRGIPLLSSDEGAVEDVLSRAIGDLKLEKKSIRRARRNSSFDDEDSLGIGSLDEFSVSVEECYLLATPVDMVNFLPSSSIIKKCYNFFSVSDYIQTALCMYARKYEVARDRITNISVAIERRDSNGRVSHTNPGHSGMHHQCIGFALFETPELFESYSDADYLKNNNQIDITFFDDNRPPVLESPVSFSASAFEIWLENIRDFADLFM